MKHQQVYSTSASFFLIVLTLGCASITSGRSFPLNTIEPSIQHIRPVEEIKEDQKNKIAKDQSSSTDSEPKSLFFLVSEIFAWLLTFGFLIALIRQKLPSEAKITLVELEYALEIYDEVSNE